MKQWMHFIAVLALVAADPSASRAADFRDSEALMVAQRKAMAALDIIDGAWRGSAKATMPNGQELDLVQTERVGSFVNGTVKVIEGRGFAADGSTVFNAMAIVSFDPQTKKYNFRSYAQGYSGDFPFELLPDGFAWSMPAGPSTMLKYRATIKDGSWVEIGEVHVAGQPPVKTFEMRLKRIGGIDWPEAGAVPRQ